MALFGGRKRNNCNNNCNKKPNWLPMALVALGILTLLALLFPIKFVLFMLAVVLIYVGVILY